MDEQIKQDGRGAEELLVLAVDTSTAALAAAIMRGGEVLQEVQSLAERNHSVHTVSVVQEMMAACGIGSEHLDGIAIGRGPGSYTGMRIAVSLGKTLAWAWNKPLLGVSSLEALAFSEWQAGSGVHTDGETAPSQTRERLSGRPVWIVPIMDARRGQVYTASFAAGHSGLNSSTAAGQSVPGPFNAASHSVRNSFFDSGDSSLVPDSSDAAGQSVTNSFFDSGDSSPVPSTAAARSESAANWTRLTIDSIRLMRDWVDELHAAVEAADDASRPAALWIVGELAQHEAEAERLRDLLPDIDVRMRKALIAGSAVAALGARKLAAGERDDVHAFAPNYTQLTEAEVKLNEKTAKQAEAEGVPRHDADRSQ